MDKSKEQFEEWFFEEVDGSAIAESLCWQAWQASRAALVVQLPAAFDSSNEDASHYEYAYLKSEVEKSLDAAGIEYK